MKLRQIIKESIATLLQPGCWTRNGKTSTDLSEFITESLDAGFVPEVRIEHTITLNGATLWASNYPYAYGSLYGEGYDYKSECFLPSRAVARRLRVAEMVARKEDLHPVKKELLKIKGLVL